MIRTVAPAEAYGLIGHPVQQSLSPFIHHYFAELTGEAISYIAIDALPDEFLNKAHLFLREGRGLNITAPFKEKALALANEISPAACAAQSANTLIKIADHVIADNTDGIGLIRDLSINQGFKLRDTKILILGAGGAARGIIAALLNENPHSVSIANRTKPKAVDLGAIFDIEALALEELAAHSFDLIINASSALAVIPAAFSADGARCYDLNYGQRTQAFKQWAKEQGANYSDGLAMLVEQAAESFYLWRGLRPKTDEILAQLRIKTG